MRSPQTPPGRQPRRSWALPAGPGTPPESGQGPHRLARHRSTRAAPARSLTAGARRRAWPDRSAEGPRPSRPRRRPPVTSGPPRPRAPAAPPCPLRPWATAGPPCRSTRRRVPPRPSPPPGSRAEGRQPARGVRSSADRPTTSCPAREASPHPPTGALTETRRGRRVPGRAAPDRWRGPQAARAAAVDVRSSPRGPAGPRRSSGCPHRPMAWARRQPPPFPTIVRTRAASPFRPAPATRTAW